MVPERLEDRIAEAHHQDVLDGLLAQIVVDAEDLSLVEHPGERLVHIARAREVVADGLLHDDAREGPRAGRRRHQTRRSQLLDAGAEAVRWNRQVEHAIAGNAAGGFDLLQARLELGVAPGIVDGAAVEEQRPFEVGPVLRVERPAREALDPLARHAAEDVVVELAPSDAHHREVRRERAVQGQVVEGRQQLALGEVTAASEDDEAAGLRQQRL
jgi:hypothetical protein